MFYFYLFIIFFSFKMRGQNVNVSLKLASIVFLSLENIFYYNISFFCENTQNLSESGDILFSSEDGKKWKCFSREDKLCNLKLDHIFTDSKITKHFTEVKSKLVPEK